MRLHGRMREMTGKGSWIRRSAALLCVWALMAGMESVGWANAGRAEEIPAAVDSAAEPEGQSTEEAANQDGEPEGAEQDTATAAANQDGEPEGAEQDTATAAANQDGEPEGTDRETAAGTAAADGTVYEKLASGAKGDAVKRMQERLIELGYDPGTADGIFGTGTRKAVKAFQKQNGLETDGVAGNKTLTALYSPDAKASPGPPEPTDVLAGDLPMLVNKEYPVGEDFLPADLVTLNDVCDSGLVKIKYKGTMAVKAAADALIKMLEAAKGDGVVKWQISAAYRSYETQVNTLNAKINSYLKRNSGWSRSRARKAALRTVAEPGCSEHHTGLAIDINVPGASSFLGTKQCKWLHEHCWEYGFIVRYQKGKEDITGFEAEAWHIRYVGKTHALYMKEHGLCLEEYLAGIAKGEIVVPEEEIEEEVDLDE